MTGNSLIWASSLDGQIGSGSSFTKDDLSIGGHTISLTAVNSHGASGSRSIAIDVGQTPNQPPDVTILSPPNGTEFSAGESIAFLGEATDPEDGQLAGSALVWSSSISGQIGTGESFSTEALPAGTHSITLTATDSEGASGFDANTIEVTSQDSYEPDNQATDASPIISPENQRHDISPATDEDWVVFTLDATSRVVLETETEGDTYLELFDSALNLIEANDDYVGMASQIIRECDIDALPGGTYYGRVTSFQGKSTIYGYMLAFASTPCGGSDQWMSIESGTSHTCGLLLSRGAYCWGEDGYGALGDGTGQQRLAPWPVDGAPVYELIATGGRHTCALDTSGAAYCWGWNEYGQLGDGTTENRLSPVSVLTSVTFSSIAVGDYHTCALTSAGDAYCWGRNRYGQLGNADRSTWTWTEPQPVSGAAKFWSITAGGAHTCALGQDGETYCWGDNRAGQLGTGSTDTDLYDTPQRITGGMTFQALSAGGAHSCGILSNGDAYCWGANCSGQLGRGYFDCVYGVPVPVLVEGGLKFNLVSCGGRHTCALTAAGVAYCWGDNGPGQLGIGTPAPYQDEKRNLPAAVAGGYAFETITTSLSVNTCGVTNSGAGYCWGHNTLGQVGNGITSSWQTAPTRVIDP